MTTSNKAIETTININAIAKITLYPTRPYIENLTYRPEGRYEVPDTLFNAFRRLLHLEPKTEYLTEGWITPDGMEWNPDEYHPVYRLDTETRTVWKQAVVTVEFKNHKRWVEKVFHTDAEAREFVQHLTMSI